MSAISLIDTAPATEPFAASAGLRAKAAATRLRSWRIVRPVLRIVFKALMAHRIRRAMNELPRLDDRMLRDIGLSRYGLEDAVRGDRSAPFAPLGPEWAWLNGKD